MSGLTASIAVSRPAFDLTIDLDVPARDRGIGVVFQDYLLFPHLTAAENIAFGPIAHGSANWMPPFHCVDEGILAS